MIRLGLYIGLTCLTAWALITYWGPTGLPFWPLMMGAAALLTLWGVLKGAWVAPLAVLAAYIAMRGVMAWADDPLQEHFAFYVWLFAGMVIFKAKEYLASVAAIGAGVTYPAMALLGFPIEYLGLAPIIGEMFAILALISIGGNFYDREHRSRSAADLRFRIHSRVAGVSHRVGEDKA